MARIVSQVIVHPDYNNTLFNKNIALMKLSSHVNFTDVRPVCLVTPASPSYPPPARPLAEADLDNSKYPVGLHSDLISVRVFFVTYT